MMPKRGGIARAEAMRMTILRTSSSVAAILLSTLVIASVGCSSSQTEEPYNNAANALGCGAIRYYPPLIVIDPPICTAPVVAITDDAIGTTDVAAEAYRCGTHQPDAPACPPPVVSGNLASCAFLINNLDDTPNHTYSVTFTEPGYVPVVAHGIHAGRSGCVPYSPPSDPVTLTLTPTPDAG
jgi:hypothetical protein